MRQVVAHKQTLEDILFLRNKSCGADLRLHQRDRDDSSSLVVASKKRNSEMTCDDIAVDRDDSRVDLSTSLSSSSATVDRHRMVVRMIRLTGIDLVP